MGLGSSKKPDRGDVAANEYGTSDRWFVLLFLTLDYFVLYLHRNIINYVQPPLKAELAINEEQLGTLQMAFLLPYAFSQLFVGYLGDHFQRRSVLIFSLSGSVLALAGMGLVNNYASLVAMRVLLAISQAASVPAIASMMADCFTPKTRSTAVGIYLVSQNIALMVAGRVGGEIADIPTWEVPLGIFGAGTLSFAGWRMAMFLFSIVGAGVVLAMVALLREPQRTERETGRGLGVSGASLRSTVVEVVKVRAYQVIAAAFVLFCMMGNVREFWLARYFTDTLGMDLGDAGGFATMYVQSSTIVGLIVGGPAADYLARRFRSGRTWVQIAGLVLMAPTLLLLGATTSKPLLIFCMMGIGFGFGLYTANLWTTTFEVIDPAARSTAIGFLNVAAMIAAPTSKYVGQGLDHNWFDLGQAFSVSSVIAVLAALLLLVNIYIFLPRDYREHDDQGPLE